jgi:hypothetical protein
MGCRPMVMACAVAGLLAGTAELSRAEASQSQAPRGAPALNPVGVFSSIDALSASDIWTVEKRDSRPAAEHWDGTTWTSFPVSGEGTLTDVDMLDSDTGFASGAFVPSASGRSTPAVEVWDGSRWTTSRLVDMSGGDQTDVLGISALSADDVWAVGPAGSTTGTGWNGARSPSFPTRTTWMRCRQGRRASTGFALGRRCLE